MQMSLTMHRYISLLFLILSSQSIFTEFTDPRSSKAHPSNGCSSSFDSTPTCKKEFNDQDNQNDIEQNERRKISFFALIKDFYENNKKNLLSQAILNDHPIYIRKKLKDEEEEKINHLK